jgi:SAM-dependent methyltransferase
MPILEAYDAFAYAYDQALGEKFFQAVRRLLAFVVDKYPARELSHLDVACGTGLAMEFFEKRGYRSVGVDASLAMLGVARRRADRLVGGDYRALPFRGHFARVTSLYDSLNHIEERDGLVAAFRSIRGVMSAESLLLFDMNHPDIYPAVWGMREPYVSTGRDHHLEIATKFRARDRIALGLVTGWAALPNGERVKIRETHRQRAWSEEEIRACLDEAELEPVEVIDFDPFQEIMNVDARGVKLFFVCRVKRA